MTEKDIVSVVEAAYRADITEKAWLDGIARAARPLLDTGRGIMAFVYDGTDPGCFKVTTTAGAVGRLPGWGTMMRYYAPKIARHHVEKRLFGPPCSTLSESVGDQFLDEFPLARTGRFVGIHDLLGVNARDLSGHGCALAIPLAARGPAPSEIVHAWARVAAHMTAGFRLRARLASAPPSDDPLASAEAILEPDGRLQHAVGAAASPEARAVLRGAAVAIDRARGALRRREPAEALEIWRGLVEGRWTIVDHFDRDGRRYVVAQRNDPEVGDAGILTLRERQALGYAALGHSNKLIAYELGLSPSTVATHLSQAAHKLGAQSRVELIRIFQGAEEP